MTDRKMRRLNLCEAIKSFVVAKPPSFLFFLCLISFFIVLCVLMRYIDTRNVRNPDIPDWNAFKKSLASLHYCIQTPYAGEEDEINLIKSQMISDPMSLNHRISHSFEVLLNIEFVDTLSNLENLTHLFGQIQGYEIGLGGLPLLFAKICSQSQRIPRNSYFFLKTGLHRKKKYSTYRSISLTYKILRQRSTRKSTVIFALKNS